MKNMTLACIAKACGGTLYEDNTQEKEVTGVVIDSRKLKEGNLFIATRGERVDGHDFISDVFQRGCMGVVCEKLPEKLEGPCILVKNSFLALQDIARFYRSQLTIQVVGITGSVGKTSTKEMIAGVLSKKFNVLKTEANFNNEIGLSLTILNIREEHEIAVLEMGINHFGEMHQLSSIARPDVCVMTNIGQCHLEYLGDRDGILRAKSEIFDYSNPNGAICVNGDDDKLAAMQQVHGISPVFFGRGSNCEVTATDIVSKGLLGTDAVLLIRDSGENVKIHIALPGEHMIDNALAAAAVGRVFAMTLSEIAEGISEVKPLSGRSNVIQTKQYILIDDCYNANPVSMRAAIDLLKTAAGRRVAVLGDMFELGKNEAALHKYVGEYAAKAEIDCIIFVGTLAKNMYDAAKTTKDQEGRLYWFATKAELLAKTDTLFMHGDTILIKASHGMGLKELVEHLQ